MKCHVCGAKMQEMVTSLPFKISTTTIIILKEVPVKQCNGCGEYLLDDSIMMRVEKILNRADTSAELEIIKVAA